MKISKKKLDTGDYSIYGWEDQVVIERKGWTDYYNCCIGSASVQMRFMKQMERLAQLPFSCIMVEGMLSRCYQGFARGDREDMSRLVYVTASITSEYSVPILFLENRNTAQDTALEWLTYTRERIDDQWMSSDFHTPIFKVVRRSRCSDSLKKPGEYDPRNA